MWEGYPADTLCPRKVPINFWRNFLLENPSSCFFGEDVQKKSLPQFSTGKVWEVVVLFFFVLRWKKYRQDSNLNGLPYVCFFLIRKSNPTGSFCHQQTTSSVFSAMPRCEKKDTTMDVTKIVETTNECLCQERAGGWLGYDFLGGQLRLFFASFSESWMGPKILRSSSPLLRNERIPNWASQKFHIISRSILTTYISLGQFVFV